MILYTNTFFFNRYLPDKSVGPNGILSSRNRSAINQEVVMFISVVSEQIQELIRMRDDLMSDTEDMTMQFEHYKLMKDSLLSVRYRIISVHK